MSKFVNISKNVLMYQNAEFEAAQGFTIFKKNKFENKSLLNPDLKYLAFDMNFINCNVTMDRVPEGQSGPTIVYIGSNSPHLEKLVMLYDFIIFRFYDTQGFTPALRMLSEQYPNRIFLDNQLPTDLNLQALHSDSVYLISNYDSDFVREKPNFPASENADAMKAEFQRRKDEIASEDMQTSMHFTKMLNPVACSLKFRPSVLQNREMIYFSGNVILPIFSGDVSIESRITVIREDFDKVVGWNCVSYKNKLIEWNRNRKTINLTNPFTLKENPLPYQLGNQFDISILFMILKDYYTTMGHDNCSPLDVYNLYSRYLVKSDNSEICKR